MTSTVAKTRKAAAEPRPSSTNGVSVAHTTSPTVAPTNGTSNGASSGASNGHSNGAAHAPVPATVKRPTRRRRHPAAGAHVGSLDLGTTKICAMIGTLDVDGEPRLLGMGQVPSRGLHRGMVQDIDMTVASISQAVGQACEQAGITLRDFHVGIAGGHLACLNTTAMVEVANPLRGVSAAEKARVMERVRAVAIPEGREIIHILPQEFVCDDQHGVRHPVGMSCSRLEVRAHIVTAAVASAQNIVRCVQKAGLRTAGLFVESLASSRAILTEDEKDLGVLLLDLGGGTTDVALFRGGAVRYSGAVPLGGNAVTRDVAHVLRISRLEAEHVKRSLGGVAPDERLGAPGMRDITVTHVLSGRKVKAPRELIREVVLARCEEILEGARELVERGAWRPRYESGVVLTGGGSLVAGIDRLASEVFDCDVRVGSPGPMGGPTACPESPIYSTGVGLLLHGLEALAEPDEADTSTRFLGRVYDRFLKLIDWYS